MRVLEDSASTSCAIMSEGKNSNGTDSDGCNSKKNQSTEQNHSPSSENSEAGFSTSGGRLKFFKDGKFILELSHRREGEKMSWIPVPKKTYWPPPVTTSTVVNCLKQESTASLSVSDDNSSVQLSPWQRDHCWKQASPRKAASLEMTFYMMPLPRAFHTRRTSSLTIKRRRRRPFDLIEKVINCSNNLNTVSVNGFQRPVKLKNSAINKNGGLNTLIQRLWDCLKSSESGGGQSVQKHSPSMFSPRKRILREFERVSLVTNNSEEQSQLNLKRQRPKASSTNGQSPTQSNSKGVSSYSITSLLGVKEEPQDQEPSFLRTLLRSPKEEPSPEPSPKSRRNSPSSQSVQSSPPPNEAALRNASFPSMQFPYMHSPLVYSHFLPPQAAAVAAHHPSYFAMPSPYRGSSSVWGVPYHPLSSLPHAGSYHGLVSPYSSQFNYWHTPPSVEVKKEDSSSDVPLNLSKHGG